MTASTADLADFKRRVDAALAAYLGQTGGEMAYSVPTPLAHLIDLVRAADDPQPGAHTTDTPAADTLADLRRDFAAFTREAWREWTHLAVVDTRMDGRAQLSTRIGWTGDTISVSGGEVGAAELHTHGLALAAAVRSCTRRIALLATTASAARKIMTLIPSPAGAAMALPIAYKFVRDIYQQWDSGGP